MRPFRSKRPTVADLLARKGKCQLTQLFIRTLEEAAAAEAAGIEMVNLAEKCCVDSIPHSAYKRIN